MFTASLRLLKWHMPLTIFSGIGCNLSLISVITPNVPSEPINKFVKLYPEDVFFALRASCNYFSGWQDNC